MNADDRAMKVEIETELARRDQQAFATLVRLHGGMEGWHRACTARHRADPEHQMAKVVWRLLGTHGRLSAADRQRLEADVPLAAYWQSVTDAGEAGWREERDRLREVERQAAQKEMPERLKMLNVYAVKSMLPTWRAWGRLIMEPPAASADS